MINNLAAILSNQGHLKEAAKILKEVLEKRKRILGEEYPDTMNNLADTLGDQGHLEEAIALLEVALQ